MRLEDKYVVINVVWSADFPLKHAKSRENVLFSIFR